ncbi:2-oxoglutarate dehydrogenase subunit E1 [Thermaurantimonas aggregans]|uniref:oxoglutarate dehydrogenase (succinyl-transferring) n=1 Tax=Thermaurantimonas aggregans TaxID=2173829 RepID=A0A401XIQ6_9FLAO|nr:2-oxoglutarate dehydrogenase E1 component [Thermaurantimonas aggregans]MCX8148845.1 2-oxoglutarate dehydrogenase E1 component [Thermaurantimonas aggregans]GCD76902.1 2-oxoglutarate dehydrogenase subunit E1 [Thermaurantimonas aggregans]
MDRFSFLNAAHLQFFDELYQKYLENPDIVEPSWRAFFQGFDFANEYADRSPVEKVKVIEKAVEQSPDLSHIIKEFRVIELINAYRQRGHLFTETNPVRARRKYSPTLDIENFGLDASDLDKPFEAARELGLNGPAPLRRIIQHLKNVYCRSIGVEFMYIRDVERRKWIIDRLNVNENIPNFTPDQKKHILTKLTEAVGFEAFLNTKFVGQKRFSIEGAESLIPALDMAINHGAELGVREVVMGMAHRGRLNVLSNIFGKTQRDIFSEFEGKEYEDEDFDGDVKYHLGYSTLKVLDDSTQIRLTLSPNPSHLEAVNAVVEGIARARIDYNHDGNVSAVLPILIHGDAAIAAQGIVYEVVQMETLDGYKTGGTIHFVINNQVGFTTNYLDARSSTYCTDVAKVILAPVFHVNGDDTEAVVHVAKFAIEYRQRFLRDIFIDLLCYRKYGHNEGDEPRFTQPLLYKIIAKHPNPRDIYMKKLKEEGLVDEEFLKKVDADFKAILEMRYDESKKIEKNRITPFLQEDWQGFRKATREDFLTSPETGVSRDKLLKIAKALTTLPADKKFFNKVVRLVEDRRKMVEERNALDWGMGELMAYGSLLIEGIPVRISGEDVERGTFSHRHAVILVEDSEEEIVQLNHIEPGQARFEIYNSLLSEYGVLGFDYGYALARPNHLVIWEAQFGDFANGAQIIIDQFISAAEDKWAVQNGLVLYLPHGYEGQGAEHSSARLERFLQLCAQLNMIVCNLTTPAQLFHMLRRQFAWPFRKPVVLMSPKSLLRHPRATSTLEELESGRFREVIDDHLIEDKATITKLVFVTGKFYYELLEEREAEKHFDTALVRIEQLYPLPYQKIEEIIASYPNAKKIVWAQEEPSNMGAHWYMKMKLPVKDLLVVCPSASASPASGSHQAAIALQKRTIKQVFSI